MQRLLITSTVIAVLVTLSSSCMDDELGVTPRPVTLDTGTLNQMTPVERLGRVLFYDTRLSANNSISCGSCHIQSLGFSDNKAFSPGFQMENSKRNSMPLVNPDAASNNAPLFWDGREIFTGNMVLQPIFNHTEMGMDNGDDLLSRIRNASYYRDMFRDAFYDDEITLSRIAQALNYFVTSIQMGTDVRANDDERMTVLELQGKVLFENSFACGNCHRPSNGYNPGDEFANIGLDLLYTDQGRADVTGNPDDDGKFKIPSLINVTLSAPYMHDGRFSTLEDVLEHYSHNIKPHQNLDPRLRDTAGNAVQMNMTSQEKAAIIAYLGAFTDMEIISSPYLSNPFH